jgi:hypothetical protein
VKRLGRPVVPGLGPTRWIIAAISGASGCRARSQPVGWTEWIQTETYCRHLGWRVVFGLSRTAPRRPHARRTAQDGRRPRRSTPAASAVAPSVTGAGDEHEAAECREHCFQCPLWLRGLVASSRVSASTGALAPCPQCVDSCPPWQGVLRHLRRVVAHTGRTAR